MFFSRVYLHVILVENILKQAKAESHFDIFDDKGTKDVQRVLARKCAHCGKSGASKTCAKCKTALYCSRECQLEGWNVSGHKYECKKLRKKQESNSGTK